MKRFLGAALSAALILPSPALTSPVFAGPGDALPADEGIRPSAPDLPLAAGSMNVAGDVEALALAPYSLGSVMPLARYGLDARLPIDAQILPGAAARAAATPSRALLKGVAAWGPARAAFHRVEARKSALRAARGRALPAISAVKSTASRLDRREADPAQVIGGLYDESRADGAEQGGVVDAGPARADVASLSLRPASGRRHRQAAFVQSPVLVKGALALAGVSALALGMPYLTAHFLGFGQTMAMIANGLFFLFPLDQLLGNYRNIRIAASGQDDSREVVALRRALRRVGDAALGVHVRVKRAVGLPTDQPTPEQARAALGGVAGWSQIQFQQANGLMYPTFFNTHDWVLILNGNMGMAGHSTILTQQTMTGHFSRKVWLGAIAAIAAMWVATPLIVAHNPIIFGVPLIDWMGYGASALFIGSWMPQVLWHNPGLLRVAKDQSDEAASREAVNKLRGNQIPYTLLGMTGNVFLMAIFLSVGRWYNVVGVLAAVGGSLLALHQYSDSAVRHFSRAAWNKIVLAVAVYWGLVGYGSWYAPGPHGATHTEFWQRILEMGQYAAAFLHHLF